LYNFRQLNINISLEFLSDQKETFPRARAEFPPMVGVSFVSTRFALFKTWAVDPDRRNSIGLKTGERIAMTYKLAGWRVMSVIRNSKTLDLNDPIHVKTQELHLLNIFMKQATTSPGDSHCLYNLMRMVSLRTGALRASIVHIPNYKRGIVIASNDDAYVRGYGLDLNKYPEILAVMKDRKAKYIQDWQQCDYTEAVLENLKNTPYESLAVFPLFIDYKFYGVMSLRMKRQQPIEAAYVQKLGDICSKIISLTLRHTAESIAA
jgi:hypothetical protein